MITGIIVAAGESRRMGKPKMLLPWGEATVLGRVIDILKASSVDRILVISGGDKEVVEALCRAKGVRFAFNGAYATGEMLSSIQAGLTAVTPPSDAALIVLGDQPQIQESTVRKILDEYVQTGAGLIVPSFQMRRGHPWLVARSLWTTILEMRPPATLREFLHDRAKEIHYVEVSTPTIIQDLDTPEDYVRSRP